MKSVEGICIDQVLLPEGPKMKTTVSLRAVCLLACLILLNGCGGKYDDLINASEEFRKAVDTFITDVENASSSKEVARALNSYVDECENVIPTLRKQFEKTPELKNLTLETAPDEVIDHAWSVKETLDRMENSRMAQMNMDRYENDPDVRKAFERMCDVFGYDYDFE